MACIILASGQSDRFGEADKLRADLLGRPLLGHVLKMVRQIEFGEVFLVSQSDVGGSVSVITNRDPKAGQGHALRLGLKAAIDAGWSHVMVLLGDMPLVTAQHVSRMIAIFEDEPALFSTANGQSRPPAIFSAPAMKMILAVETAEGAKAIFNQLDPATYPMPAQMALDVDTPEDLARVEAMMKARAI